MRILIMSACLLMAAVATVSGADLRSCTTAQTTLIQNASATEARSLIQFDIAELANQRVDRALVDLQFCPPADSAEHYTIVVLPLATSWSTEADWSTSWSTAGGDVVEGSGYVASVSRKNNYKATVDLTEITRLWASRQLENHGVLIMTDQPGSDHAVLQPVTLGNIGQTPTLEVRTSAR